MKKILLGVIMLLNSTFMISAQGVEGVIVEKFYVTDGNDATGSTSNGGGTLPTGSVVWRFYIDLAAGYELQAVYGDATHPLSIVTSTSFFNNEDRGATTSNAIGNQYMDDNSVMIDSYVSMGAASSTKLGVLKSEDDGVGTIVNADGMLQNNDPTAAPALTVEDGFFSGATAPQSVTVVGPGLTASLSSVFDATSQAGDSLGTDNGSWSVLGGAVGAYPSNTVLVAQVTSDGVINYALNVQVRNTGTGAVENYVYSNPVGTEILLPALTGVLNQPNALPTVTINNPANGSSFTAGASVAIDATATDNDGTITQVEFFVDNVSIGIDNTAPYEATWTATAGVHTIEARATDDLGGIGSDQITVSVGAVIPPTVSITSPAGGSVFLGGNFVTIDATAADVDGTVTQVEFFVNGTSVGVDATSPYSATWTSVIGTANLTAVATDNDGATATSAIVTIQVIDPNASYALGSSVNNCAQSTFCLPVNAVAAVSNVIGYDIELNFDNTKVEPTGVVIVADDLTTSTFVSTANSINIAQGKMYISAFFNSSAPSNAAFAGTGELLCIEFAKLPGFGSPDTAEFTVTTLNESLVTGVTPKVVSAGQYITESESEFSSKLVFWADNSPIQYDSNNPSAFLITNIYGDQNGCTGPLSATAVQPDLNGEFTYNTNNGPSINIQKDIVNTTDVQPVINGFDAFLTRRVLINDPTYVPSVFEMIAMDVNTDGFVSAGDLTQINKRAVLSIGEFAQDWNYDPAGNPTGAGPSKDWIFVDVSRVNSNPQYTISVNFPFADGSGYYKNNVPTPDFCLVVPTQTSGNCVVFDSETYSGILVGDVNGNFATVSPSNEFRNSGSKVVFDLANAVVGEGYIDVPVRAESINDINSLDFAMNYNISTLNYQAMIDHTGHVEMLANYNVDDSKLRFTSFSLDNYDLSQKVVSIRFATGASSISEEDLLSIDAYLNGEPVQAEVLKTGISSGSDVSVSVFPNPASNMFNLVVSEDASVQIFDAAGRLVFAQENVMADQKTTINAESLDAGIYTLRTFNSNFNSTKKVVINK